MAADFNAHFQRLFTIFMSQLSGVLAPSINITVAYENGSDEEQAFIQNLALFFTAFFRVGAWGRVCRCFGAWLAQEAARTRGQAQLLGKRGLGVWAWQAGGFRAARPTSGGIGSSCLVMHTQQAWPEQSRKS